MPGVAVGSHRGRDSSVPILRRTKPCLSMALLFAAMTIGCGQQPQPSAMASNSSRPAEFDFPRILSVSPETVPFADNKVTLGTFHVAYRIDHPELVDNASLELFSASINISSMEVPVTQNGEADLKIDKAFEIGPAVKLQAHCPTGGTNWLTVGALRPARSKAIPRIDNITPDSIPGESPIEAGNGGADAPVALTLWGDGFSPECKVSYSVNDGDPIDAYTAFQGTQQLVAQVTRRPLYPFSWSSRRYLELKLVVTEKAVNNAKEDVRAIPSM